MALEDIQTYPNHISFTERDSSDMTARIALSFEELAELLAIIPEGQYWQLIANTNTRRAAHAASLQTWVEKWAKPSDGPTAEERASVQASVDSFFTL